MPNLRLFACSAVVALATSSMAHAQDISLGLVSVGTSVGSVGPADSSQLERGLLNGLEAAPEDFSDPLNSSESTQSVAQEQKSNNARANIMFCLAMVGATGLGLAVSATCIIRNRRPSVPKLAI